MAGNVADEHIQLAAVGRDDQTEIAADRLHGFVIGFDGQAASRGVEAPDFACTREARVSSRSLSISGNACRFTAAFSAMANSFKVMLHKKLVSEPGHD